MASFSRTFAKVDAEEIVTRQTKDKNPTDGNVSLDAIDKRKLATAGDHPALLWAVGHIFMCCAGPPLPGGVGHTGQAVSNPDLSFLLLDENGNVQWPSDGSIRSARSPLVR